MITSAQNTHAEGPKVARLGDTLMCPLHGPQPIVTASTDTITEGKGTARHGDIAACGASLISGASKTVVN